jgi:hypothetical protein
MSLIQFRSIGDSKANTFSPIGNSLPTVMNFYTNKILNDFAVPPARVNGLIVPSNKFNIVGDFTVAGNVFTGGASGVLLQRCTTSSVSSAASDFTLVVKRKPGLNVADLFTFGLLTNANVNPPTDNYTYGLFITASTADSPTQIQKKEGATATTVFTSATSIKQAGIDILYRIQRVNGSTSYAYSVDDGVVWTALNTSATTGNPVVYPSLFAQANQGIVVMESVGFS